MSNEPIQYRQILNNIVTKNKLSVSLSVMQEGPGHATSWISVYTLQGVGVIGNASHTAKETSKDYAAWQAVTWLQSRNYWA